MRYMLDKIEKHEKKDEIIRMAQEILKLLKEDLELDNSEKLLTIELAVAQLNYDLYGVSGDKK